MLVIAVIIAVISARHATLFALRVITRICLRACLFRAMPHATLLLPILRGIRLRYIILFTPLFHAAAYAAPLTRYDADAYAAAVYAI